ncbi:MAG TPA: MazG family protein [Chlamydiales bacterium]|nr:MazG family protein [Chlamydiales bacterium]
MDAFNKLIDVANRLLGPNGCPWDQEQTLRSLQPYLLEEAHELVDAIDSLDANKMKEELGDFFYTAVFVSKLAEKEGLFSLHDALLAITEKLIRRHPHIFGETKVSGSEDVMRNWEEIKMKEGRVSLFEGIPSTLPSLSTAQKIVSKLRRKKLAQKKETNLKSEEELAEKIWQLVEEAETAGFDAETALRRLCKSKVTGV